MVYCFSLFYLCTIWISKLRPNDFSLNTCMLLCHSKLNFITLVFNCLFAFINILLTLFYSMFTFFLQPKRLAYKKILYVTIHTYTLNTPFRKNHSSTLIKLTIDKSLNNQNYNHIVLNYINIYFLFKFMGLFLEFVIALDHIVLYNCNIR